MKSLDFIGDFFFQNNSLLDKNSGSLIVEDGLSVYEVLKIISGSPLFVESHIERLQNSLKLSNIEGFVIAKNEFLPQVKKLCEVNGSYFGNMELRVVKTINSVNFFLGFVSHKYPSPLDYINGVNTSLINLIRENPNAKVKHTQARVEANNFLDKSLVFEVLLVNSNDFITEGSRSNMFYIKNNIVYTSSIEFVLPGITRKYVIEAIENLNITIQEKLLSVEELDSIDAAFLCGTSLGILPIKQIDNYEYDVKNKLLRAVMLEFNDIIKQYVISNTG